MIETKTTLILGAGASVDYGYPLGDRLIEQIAGLGSDNGFTRYYYVGGWVPAVNSLIERLKTGAFRSIDHFLGSYQLDELTKKAGKRAISFVLNRTYFLQKERPVQCNPSTPSWHQLLSQALFSGIEKPTDLAKNKLSIVTFNYDLSLELFLITQIKAHWPGVDDNELRNALSSVSVVHVYGDLGDPIEYFYRLRGGTAELSQETIETSAERIHVIPENRAETTDEFARAHKLIADSERVAMLGFGFDLDNLKRLNLRPLIDEPNVVSSQGRFVASAYGMRYAELLDIHTRFFPKVWFEARDETVYDCLRDFGLLNQWLPIGFDLHGFKTTSSKFTWFPRETR